MPTRSFTLIELLIVIAIIAILAAIAVPNFLEAQTRSKVSRAKSDLRIIKGGLESYRVDHNNYPWHIPLNIGPDGPELRGITTPLAYLSSLPMDPFRSHTQWNNILYPGWYDYTRFIQYVDGSGTLITKFWNCFGFTFRQYPSYYGYAIFSLGPDKKEERAYTFEEPFSFFVTTYDPSNGTISAGDIYDFGGVTNVQ